MLGDARATQSRPAANDRSQGRESRGEHASGAGGLPVDSIEGAHAGFETLLGGGTALAFAVALLSSGLSSSSVGTHSGQVMQGFIPPPDPTVPVSR